MTGPSPAEPVGTRAFRCLICDRHADWRLSRIGDAVVSWACGSHLAMISDDLLMKHYTHLRLTRSDTDSPEVER